MDTKTAAHPTALAAHYAAQERLTRAAAAHHAALLALTAAAKAESEARGELGQ